MFKKIKSQSGVTIIDVIVAIGVFVIIAPAIVNLALASYRGTLRTENQIESLALAQQGLEATRSIKNYNWNNLTTGDHGLATSSGYWDFSGTSESIDDFTRTINISDTADEEKTVTSTVQWNDFSGASRSLALSGILTNWGKLSWLQTTLMNFHYGFHNSVDAANISGGEIQLGKIGDWDNSIVKASQDFSGTANITGLFVDKNNLFVTTDANASAAEFFVFDISAMDYGTLTQLGSLEIGNGLNDVTTSQGYAYLASDQDDQEVQIVRLSDYTKVNSIDIPDTVDALSLKVSGNTLYVGTEISTNDEFYAYDISSPEAAIDGDTPLGSYNVGDSVNDLAISDGYAYLATGDDLAELQVIKLSDYSSANSLDLSGTANITSIEIIDDTAYLGRAGSSDSEFYAIDISTPESSLSIIDEIDLSTVTINDFSINNDVAYAATNNADTQEIAILDLSSYTVDTYVDLTGSANLPAIFFKGTHIYAGSTDDTYTLQVFTSATNGWVIPIDTDTYNLTGSAQANDVFVTGTSAYVVTANTGDSNPEFYIFDISTPSSISLTGSYDLNASGNSVYVSGDYAYIATSDDSKELLILDISVPASPSEAGSYDSDEGKDGLAVYVSGTEAYLGTVNNGGSGDEEFYAIDVSTPATPSLLDTLEVGDNVNDIKISGNYAYLATARSNKELLIANISTPSALSETGSYDRSGATDAHGLYYDSGYIYLACDYDPSTDDFEVIDVSTPATPTKLSGLTLGENNQDVYLLNYTALVVSENTGSQFEVIDVNNPINPSYEGNYDLGADANGLYSDGTYIYLATENSSKEVQVLGSSIISLVYGDYGIFTSQAKDTGTSSTGYQKISWNASGTGTIAFQIRTADTEANLSSAKWVGSDGTINTTYTTSGTSIVLDPAATGAEWIQFRAILSGTSATTPIMEDVTITYVQ